jgi:hypothetical protein
VDYRIGDNDLGAARPAPGFRPIRLNQGAFPVIPDRCGISQNTTRKDNALASEAGDDDFFFHSYSHVTFIIFLPPAALPGAKLLKGWQTGFESRKPFFARFQTQPGNEIKIRTSEVYRRSGRGTKPDK